MKGLTKTKYPSVYSYISEEKRFDGKPDECLYFTYNEKIEIECENGEKKTKWAKRWVKVGWRSDKVTAAYAAGKRTEFLNQLQNGESPTLAMSRQGKSKGITYAEAFKIFKEVWFSNLKGKGLDMVSRYDTHIGPRFGKKSINSITPLELEEYKTELLQNALAPATTRLILGDMRNVINKLKKWGKFKGESPFEQVQMPKVDNARTRFLSRQEADLLLSTINSKSRQMFLLSTISINTGARLGEIIGTTIHDLHLENRTWQIRGKTGRRTITINDAAYNAFAEALGYRKKIVVFPAKLVDDVKVKFISQETGLFFTDVRYVHLECIDIERMTITYRRRNNGKFNTYRITEAVKPIFEKFMALCSSDLVFTARNGQPILNTSVKTFDRAATECGLNHKGVAPLDKVVFHTLRHTYCSWQAQKGTPLFTIARLVGHKTTAMTERYSHLCPQAETQQLINQENTAEQLHALMTALVAKGTVAVPQAVLDWLGDKVAEKAV